MIRSLTLFLSLAIAAFHARANCIPSWTEVRSSQMPHGMKSVADLNEDGRADVVSVMVSTISIALMDADTGTFAETTQISSSGLLTSVAVFDANDDDHVDLILANESPKSIVVLPGNGDGTFGSAIVSSLTTVPGTIVAGDFNGDGNLDVAGFTIFKPVLGVWLSDGAGHFAQAAMQAHSASTIAVADFDGDGHTDVLADGGFTLPLSLFRGDGSGALAAAVAVPFDRNSSVLAGADVDGDDDVDIVAGSPTAFTISILRNNGDGTFAEPVHHSTLPSPEANGGVYFLATGDVSGDDRPEIFSVLPSEDKLVMLVNEGDGTFADAQFKTLGLPNQTNSVFLHDLTGDTRKDLVLGNTSGLIALLPNDCLDSVTITATATALVSAGDTVTVKVTLEPERNQPPATGTISIHEGDVLLTSGTPDELAAGIEVAGLGVGTHTLRAEYSGDLRYASATTTVETRVTDEVTTVTVLVDRTELPFDELLTISVIAPEGVTEIYIDDVFRGGAPLSINYLELGTRQIRARYRGTSEHPRANSAPVAVTVVKAQPTLEVPNNSVSRLGNTQLWVGTMRNGNPTGGLIELYEGTTFLTSVVSLVHVNLPLGRHVITARYEGSDMYLPAEATFVHTVVENAPVGIDVTVVGGQLVATWLGNGTTYSLERRVNGLWTTVLEHTAAKSWTLPNPQLGIVYVYRVVAYDEQLAPIGTSNADLAMLANFKDETLLAGTTLVKAVHVTELVSAINYVRGAAQLAPVSLTNAAAGKPIVAQHLTQLRTALNEARTTLGAFPLTFAELGTTMRTSHIQQLRDGVR